MFVSIPHFSWASSPCIMANISTRDHLKRWVWKEIALLFGIHPSIAITTPRWEPGRINGGPQVFLIRQTVFVICPLSTPLSFNLSKKRLQEWIWASCCGDQWFGGAWAPAGNQTGHFFVVVRGISHAIALALLETEFQLQYLEGVTMEPS